jgi:carbonic anhydrase/acetyltransferase-like protein (isoleucine patch superfamily)
MSDDVGYTLDLSRHRKILPLYDQVPQISNSWVAPNSTLVGNVFVSKYATIWYGVTIRAELNAVRIGHFSSIGDRCSIYTHHSLPHGICSSVNIGKNVTIEDNCTIHSCIIDDDVVIGSGSII